MYPRLHLKVITPTKRLLDQEGVDAFACKMIETGAIEVLPGHLPLVGVTQAGTVEYLVGEDLKEMHVGSGILDVEKNSVTLLVIGEGMSMPLPSKDERDVNKSDRLLGTYLLQLRESRREKE